MGDHGKTHPAALADQIDAQKQAANKRRKSKIGKADQVAEKEIADKKRKKKTIWANGRANPDEQ